MQPDGTFIPANTICVFSPAILNYLDTIYGIDADEFKPDRWIKEDDDTGQQKIWNPSPFEYPTFNAGPRLCLGKSMVSISKTHIYTYITKKQIKTYSCDIMQHIQLYNGIVLVCLCMFDVMST